MRELDLLQIKTAVFGPEKCAGRECYLKILLHMSLDSDPRRVILEGPTAETSIRQAVYLVEYIAKYSVALPSLSFTRRP